jgi:hypothetical protein
MFNGRLAGSVSLCNAYVQDNDRPEAEHSAVHFGWYPALDL